MFIGERLSPKAADGIPLGTEESGDVRRFLCIHCFCLSYPVVVGNACELMIATNEYMLTPEQRKCLCVPI